MNAITPPPSRDEERTSRHRRICQRLIELAMQLTEAAAIRAQTDLETASPQPAPDPDPAAPPRRPADPTLAFTRLSSAARQAMAYEARIDAAEHAAETGQPFRHHYPAGEDLRGPVLHPILRAAAAARPDRPDLPQQAAQLLETQLLIDIHGVTSAGQLLASICRELGLQPDYATFPPELLDALHPDGATSGADIWRPPDEAW